MSFNLPSQIKLLLGKRTVKTITSKPLERDIINFFNALSIEIFKDIDSKKYEDVLLYAFFIRKSNINNIEQSINENLVGRGLALHINTSNVPLNFAYSLFYGLIFGNTNILKISKNKFPQVDFLIKKIKKILSQKKFIFIKNRIFIIQYNNQNEVSNALSSKADVRLLWGSDQTIEKFNNYKTLPRVVDLKFPDRISLSLIDSKKYTILQNKIKLFDDFYKDTMYFDQLGCSSPHSVIWIGKNSKKISQEFWSKFSKRCIEKYPFDLRKSYDKYNYLFKLSNLLKENSEYKYYENRFLVYNLNKYNHKMIRDLKGLNGIFFQSFVNNINDVENFISKKTQTLTYFGLEKTDLLNLIYNKSLLGIDRIVEFGSALNMNMNWDGYNLKSFLTRKIEDK